MFRRYHHGHSAALGFLLALAMERHTLTLVLMAALVGLVAGRAWAFWTDAARALRDKLLHAKAEPIRTRPEPVYATRARRSSAGGDGIPF